MRPDTNARCPACQGGKKVLVAVGTSTTAGHTAVGRRIVDCATCDDGTGPTGLALVPGRPSGRQVVARLFRKLGSH
jgi:hypothetical protein